MSFSGVGSALSSGFSGVGKLIGKAFGGMMPEAPSVPQMTAPTAANSAVDLDIAAQKAAASMSRGRTSTMLTGGQGEDESLLKTSRTLLGR